MGTSFWKKHIKAGNLTNRGTTGAVTLRQPFGGMGKSALGPGIRPVRQITCPNSCGLGVGFPRVDVIKKDHALLRLAQEWQRKADSGAFRIRQTISARRLEPSRVACYHVENEFSQENDYFHLRGQDNILRYLPVGRVMVRIHAEDSLFDVLARIAAVGISGCELMISVAPEVNHPAVSFLRSQDGSKLAGNQVVAVQTDREVIDSMPGIQRIRYADPRRVPADVFEAAAKTGYYIARSPVLMEGRIELLHYYVNQSICDAYHRYGNLAERSTI